MLGYKTGVGWCCIPYCTERSFEANAGGTFPGAARAPAATASHAKQPTLVKCRWKIDVPGNADSVSRKATHSGKMQTELLLATPTLPRHGQSNLVWQTAHVSLSLVSLSYVSPCFPAPVSLSSSSTSFRHVLPLLSLYRGYWPSSIKHFSLVSPSTASFRQASLLISPYPRPASTCLSVSLSRLPTYLPTCLSIFVSAPPTPLPTPPPTHPLSAVGL